jgi:hypothetical protein
LEGDAVTVWVTVKFQIQPDRLVILRIQECQGDLNAPKQRGIRRKRRVIEYAEQSGNIRKACRYFGVGRSSFYLWRFLKAFPSHLPPQIGVDCGAGMSVWGLEMEALLGVSPSETSGTSRGRVSG